MAMPDDAHIIKFKVTKVMEATRTWIYDSEHEHGGCFRKDPARPNVGAEQSDENDITMVCIVIHLAAPCTHMVLNQIMPDAAQHNLRRLQPPTVGDDDANTRLRLRAQQCAAEVAYSAAPRQVQDDVGTALNDLSDNRSDVRAIREFLFTPSLDLPPNCRARYANFVAQEHHAHHTEKSRLFERTRCPKRVLGQLWPTSQKCVCV